jgi:hypothetical protein
MPNQPKPRAPGEPKQSPSAKGDPRLKRGGSTRHPNSLANLKAQTWKPGQSGNPSGKSATINEVMRLARSHCAEAVERLVEIMRDKSVPPRETIAACMAIMDRGMGRCVVPVFKGTANGFPSDMIQDVGADGALTPLLIAAGQNAGDTYKQTLQDELKRIETEERLAKEARRDQVNRAAAKLANGEPVEPSLALLARVRGEAN